MCKELSENAVEQKDDSKEIVVIKYHDRIHNQWIDLPVTKEVARFMESNRKNRKRSQDKFEQHTKQFDKVFMPSKPNNERFLIAPDTDYETIKEKQQKEKIEEFEIEHNRVLIENSLDSLTPAQREAIEMAFYKNMSYNEIAKILGITKSSVQTRMKNAEKNIKTHIKNTEN